MNLKEQENIEKSEHRFGHDQNLVRNKIVVLSVLKVCREVGPYDVEGLQKYERQKKVYKNEKMKHVS